MGCFALSWEASHAKGMGHVFRCLNLARVLLEQGERVVFVGNAYPPAENVLAKEGFSVLTVDWSDDRSAWEKSLIEREGITVWVNDRLATSLRHAQTVKACGITLVTFDDEGEGAALSDCHVAALSMVPEPRGARVLRGEAYLILNPEIRSHRRQRRCVDRVVVSLGGTDTYGVTIKVVEFLKRMNQPAVVHCGPGFRHDNELARVVDARFPVVRAVPSLPEFFSQFDAAVTGGGVTAFEANAAGLPCLIMANETFEIPNGERLRALGTSIFLGYHDDVNEDLFAIGWERLCQDVKSLSRNGLARLSCDGALNVYQAIIGHGQRKNHCHSSA